MPSAALGRGKHLGLAALLLSLAACARTGLGPQGPPTPSEPATPTPTSSPTATATPTPTPTPTALPAVVDGDPRSLSFSDPVRQSGAPCGFVDTFDFPLDPPDGAAASGGGDFGRFRDRYDGYHAGEDWRLGRSSFGQPVYSIGHGQVTYAQPLGWGADKGVVIVQHTFRDGRRVLSFYGHLDPPSVVLRAGQCVTRGDQVGEVGDPRTSPHLHFEIRLHLPDTPGPGYWPSDPRRAGWLPPSATVWLERIAEMPGVAWTRLSDDEPLRPLGLTGDAMLLASDTQLLAVDRLDGRTIWAQLLPESTTQVLLDGSEEQAYLADSGGGIQSYSVPELAAQARSGSLPEPQWTITLDRAGSAELIPLPQGGLVAASRAGLTGISSSGQVLWTVEAAAALSDWAAVGDSVLLATADGVWMAGPAGAARLNPSPAGQRLAASPQPYIYAEDGLYRVDPATRAASLFYGLPLGFPRLGDLTELPDGGVLVAHRDLDDTRLIAISADGVLEWDRSIRALEARAVRLEQAGGRLLLVVQSNLGNATAIDLYQVDLQDGGLLRLFSGGTRSGGAIPIRIGMMQDLMLISIDGVGAAAWSPEAALQSVTGG